MCPHFSHADWWVCASVAANGLHQNSVSTKHGTRLAEYNGDENMTCETQFCVFCIKFGSSHWPCISPLKWTESRLDFLPSSSYSNISMALSAPLLAPLQIATPLMESLLIDRFAMPDRNRLFVSLCSWALGGIIGFSVFKRQCSLL